MAHIPPDQARRIDRLARSAHAFHRFAHHPLCAAYAGELIRVRRRTYLCRGCTYVALGAAGGMLLAILLPVLDDLTLAAASALAAGAAVLALRAPLASHGRKLRTRALPAALLVAVSTSAARRAVAVVASRGAGAARWQVGMAPALAILVACLAALGVAIVRYRRHGPDRVPCRTCDERDSARTCSGFARIARREAAFSRLAGRLLAGRGRSLGS